MNDKTTFKAALRFLCLATLIALPIQAQAEKIAYVDARRLVNEAPQGADEIKVLEEKFSERNRELQGKIQSFQAREVALQKNALTLSAEERTNKTNQLVGLQRTLRREQDDYNEDYERSRNQGLARLENLISEVIIELAKQEKIDLVLQQAVYASAKIDFTNQILEELKKRHSAKQ